METIKMSLPCLLSESLFESSIPRLLLGPSPDPTTAKLLMVENIETVLINHDPESLFRRTHTLTLQADQGISIPLKAMVMPITQILALDSVRASLY
jgi:hypothetical protein